MVDAATLPQLTALWNECGHVNKSLEKLDIKALSRAVQWPSPQPEYPTVNSNSGSSTKNKTDGESELSPARRNRYSPLISVAEQSVLIVFVVY